MINLTLAQAQLALIQVRNELNAKPELLNDAEHWITVNGGEHAETGEKTGKHILINGEGEVIGGAGGALNGKKLEHVKSKSGDVEKPKDKEKEPEQKANKKTIKAKTPEDALILKDNSKGHVQRVADMKEEFEFKNNSRKRGAFIEKHKGKPFSQALANNDHEKAIDDIYRGYVDIDDAKEIFADAKESGLLNALSEKKVSNFLDDPEFIKKKSSRATNNSINKSKRQEVLEQSLEKKTAELDRRFDNHFEFAASTNGQPLNDKGRKGHAALNKMEQQKNAISNQIKEVEKTKKAIEREEYKHLSSQEALKGMPEIVVSMVDNGELKQWRKFPDHFFVDGVDKGRIVIKDGVAYHKYLKDVSKEQYPKFRDTYNKINRWLKENNK